MGGRSLYGLDAVRFFAAMLVVCYHLGYSAWINTKSIVNVWMGAPADGPIFGNLFAAGWVGVQLFFVISGFVIANSANGQSPYNFLSGRVRRLVPAAWIGATLALVVMLFQGASVGALVRPWFDVIIFYPLGPWLLGQFWTLPVEIAFYGMILGLLAIDRFRDILRLASIIAVAALGYWIAVVAGMQDGHVLVTRLLLLQHGSYFALGIVMWEFWRFGGGFARYATFMIALVGIVVELGAGHGDGVGSIRPDGGIDAGYRFDLGVGGLAAYVIFGLSAIVLWLSVRFNDRLAWLDRHARAVRLIGLMTYPLYLTHMHVGGTVLAVAANHGMAPAAGLVVGIAASLAVALFMAAIAEPIGQTIIRRAVAAFGTVIARRWGREAGVLRATKLWV